MFMEPILQVVVNRNEKYYDKRHILSLDFCTDIPTYQSNIFHSQIFPIKCKISFENNFHKFIFEQSLLNETHFKP